MNNMDRKWMFSVVEWSCTICNHCFLYFRLTGYHLFDAPTYNKIVRKNMEGQFSLKFKDTGVDLSNEIIDLLEKMLNPNPNERLSIE